MDHTGPGCSDFVELVDAMRAHFDREELASLRLSVAQINAWNRRAKPFAWQAGVFQAG